VLDRIKEGGERDPATATALFNIALLHASNTGNNGNNGNNGSKAKGKTGKPSGSTESGSKEGESTDKASRAVGPKEVALRNAELSLEIFMHAVGEKDDRTRNAKRLVAALKAK